jgi:hypothetical protein
VSFAFDPVPTLSIVPAYRANVLSARVGRSIKLHGSAATSGCAASFLEPRDELQYSWTQLTGPAFLLNTDTSNTPVLYVGPGALRPNQNYTLNLRAQHSTYTGFLGQTQVDIAVVPTQPFAEIAGGSRSFTLTRSPRIELVLDASGTLDFDELSGAFSYAWYTLGSFLSFSSSSSSSSSSC